MFGLFKSKRNYFIGVDFGTSAVKIVEFCYRNQRINLENYGWVDLGLIPNSENNQLKFETTYENKLKIYLAKIIQKMKLNSDSAFVSLPGFNGLVTLIDFPEMKDDELEKAIQFEAHKYIPTPLDEVSLSWDVISRTKDKGQTESGQIKQKRIQVILVAAPKKEISKYEKIFDYSGLSIQVIELETFALSRALIGEDLGTFLIIDIGARATNIVLVDKGIIKANRNIDAGGNEVTNTIADSLNVSKVRAEMLKKDKKDLLNSKELSIVIPTFELINNEVLRIISAYKDKNKSGRIDGIILSGGGGKLVGLDEYFSKSIGIKTIVGDPWKKIYFEERMKPLINDLGGSFSVVIGLAMRGVEEYKRK